MDKLSIPTVISMASNMVLDRLFELLQILVNSIQSDLVVPIIPGFVLFLTRALGKVSRYEVRHTFLAFSLLGLIQTNIELGTPALNQQGLLPPLFQRQ